LREPSLKMFEQFLERLKSKGFLSVVGLVTLSLVLSWIVVEANLDNVKLVADGGDLIIDYGSLELPSVVYENWMEINLTGARHLQLYSVFLVAATLSWVSTVIFLIERMKRVKVKFNV
jgi:hypothetical protein